MGVKVDSVPHDILKVTEWGRHADRRAIENFFPESVRGKYKIAYKDIEGKTRYKTLEQIIEGHHRSKGGYWEALWAYADKLSTPAGRFRLEYDYWYWCGADPFLVRVYGDVKEWSRDERSKLAKMMVSILEKYCDVEGEQHKAFEEINELLGDFPSESRFPYTSLKTHHWLTDTIRKNEVFWKKFSSAKLRREEPTFNHLYIARISISEVQFHRLKEIRGFIELREKILKIAGSKLSAFSPLQIGDDLYLVYLEEDELRSIINLLIETGFGFDVSIFEWSIAREKRHVRINGRPEEIYVIKNVVEKTPISVGVYEDFDYIPESSAEYSKILEGDYEYVAWISIEPKGGMKDLSQRFLEWGESELKTRYADRRRELKEPVKEPTALLSPEIALSIAEGYNEFLEDCAKAINPANPIGSVVVKSFSRAIFIRGLTDLSQPFKIYNRIAFTKANLHIPSVFSVVTVKPKYPFWRILELFEHDVDCLIFVVGEKMVKLTDDVVHILRNVAGSLRQTSRSQFSEIIRASRRSGLEELKFMIEGKAVDGKIPFNASKKLCWFIDELSKKYSGDELNAVLWRCFKSLEPYTRKEGRRWRK